MRAVFFASFLLLWCSFVASAGPQVIIQYGTNIPVALQDRVQLLITKATSYPVQIVPPSEQPESSLTAGSFLLSFGKTATGERYLNYSQLLALGPEGFVAKSLITATDVRLVVGDGNAGDPEYGRTSGGAAYAMYRLLEELGFAFLHPLQPTIPVELRLRNTALDLVERPRWPVRGTHYHTEHPLELTEVLNGFGDNYSYADEQGWRNMLPEVQLFAEWLVANRQNRVQWILLYVDQWKEFASSAVRKQRLQEMNTIFQDYGVMTGADVPIAMRQQHAWYMIQEPGSLESELAQIASRIDWLVDAGFDFLATESGSSEFTHPTDTSMLAWMEFTANYSMEKHQIPSYIKCHCSTGQVCKNYKDPRTDEPLNFNFLPMMASPSLGIYPHTVQMYAFDEPAPTYGNTNFTYMLDFMMYEASRRPTIYHGETAYWVNYDIDVPLFLPLYGAARLRDLRIIAARETETSKILGEVNFSSGWEWGYWLNDVMLARAAWNPLLELSEEDALLTILTESLSVLGPEATKSAVRLIAELITAERELLVYGRVNGTEPPTVLKRNGQAYLQGWDTWANIGALTGQIQTQPTRVGPIEIRTQMSKPSYAELNPLLVAMDKTFNRFLNDLEALQPAVNPVALPLFNEIVDSMQMTALRAAHVSALYDYAATWPEGSTPFREERKKAAEMAMSTAAMVVARRERFYRVPVDRIAGWRRNPTVYTYGYLWTVHSLYYMWRDYDQAMLASASVISPCYMNIINPADVAFGEGILLNVTEIARELFEQYKWADFVTHCLAAPKEEPHYPVKKI